MSSIAHQSVVRMGVRRERALTTMRFEGEDIHAARQRPRRPGADEASHAGQASYRSGIVIEGELVRVRPERYLDHLVVLEFDPGLDQVAGEHIALQEIAVVGVQRIEHLGQ